MLAFDFLYSDLNSLSGLKKLDKFFIDRLKESNSELYSKLIEYRKLQSNNIEKKDLSNFLVSIAPILDDFLAELFGIEQEVLSQKHQSENYNPIHECKRKFIQRHVVSKYSTQDIEQINFQEVSNKLTNYLNTTLSEITLSSFILSCLSNPEENNHKLKIASDYCAYMIHINSTLALFDIPRKIDPDNHIRPHKIGILKNSNYLGFNYRDPDFSKEKISDIKAHNNAHYCIFCHNQEKDSCSTGLKDKASNEIIEDKKGCPLKQKISEMAFLKSHGFNISALAMIIIDNPLVAATGHRICNDCMKSCIYQKQDPVNIPLIESNILEQTLELPWGAEIYSLLTKWNPLNIDAPLPLASTKKNILVTGMGPSGFALSHYLLNEGHNVVAIDGLKIDELGFDYAKPIKNWNDIKQSLNQKKPTGFGGVAEYGITARWNKNNLTLIRILLQRRQNFSLHGGVRLGSNITTSQAFDSGFNHIALCLGAGKPRYANLPGYFAKGVKPAADFLMSLQQNGDFLVEKKNKHKVRMPCVVIGCGLTAIDSAVELMHYYPEYAINFYHNWVASKNKDISHQEQKDAEEIIMHAKMFLNAKDDAEKLEIMQKLGGVTICYRKEIKDSPAYKLNHEEIEHAMAIGVKFKENITPKEIITDECNKAQRILFQNEIELEAKTVLIAIGTEENEFQDLETGSSINSDIFISDKKNISYFGDCNQKYSGSVVKALASAKNGYKKITQQLLEEKDISCNKIQDTIFESKITNINRLAPDILELIIKSEFASKNTKAGQFFKLQNYSDDFRKTMKPLALTVSEINKTQDTLSFIIKQDGTASKLCRNLKIGEKVSLMGPAGSNIKIKPSTELLLIGSDISNLLMLTIARLAKENNCRVVQIANYSNDEVIYQNKIEQHTDSVIWSSKTREIKPSREHDHFINGTISDSIEFALQNNILIKDVQVFCNLPMQELYEIQQNNPELTGNIMYNLNVKMHCMMKGICGKCIVKSKSKDGYIFACTNQIQYAGDL